MKTQKQEEKSTKVEAKQKVAKPKKVTTVSIIRAVANVGAKDKKALATLAFKKLQELKITKNSKGFDVKEEKVLTLLNAMCRDINNEREGWWKATKIVETENLFKFEKKGQ